MFVFTPWIENLGIQNMFVSAAMISLITLIAPIMALRYGKTARAKVAGKYRFFASRQPIRRAV